MHAGIPFLRERRLYSIAMPNSFNFAFSYHLFVQARACCSPAGLSNPDCSESVACHMP